VAGRPRGLLIEEARTNSVWPSEDFTHANWVNVGTPTVTAGGSAPGGTGQVIEDNDAAGDEGKAASVAVANDTSYWTVSFFVKSGTISTCRVEVLLTGGTTTKMATGSFGLSALTASGTGDAVDALIDDVGGGWRRVSVTVQNNGTGNTTLTGRILVGAQASDTGTIEVWGAQIERAAVPTSYIATATGAVTRAGDVMTIPATFLNDTAGTVYLEIDWDNLVNANAAQTVHEIMALNDGTSLNVMDLVYDGRVNQTRFELSGTGLTAINGTAKTADGIYKIAFSYDGNGAELVVNGASEGTSGTGFTGSGLNQVQLGRKTSSFNPAARVHFRRIEYRPVRLASGAMQALTA